MIQTSSFKAYRWLANRHLQTLWPSQFRQINPLPFRRQAITTHDQDIVYLDIIGPSPLTGASAVATAEKNISNNAPIAPLILMLHGLTGSSQSSYIQGYQHAFAKQGWRSITLNFRGCIEHPNYKAHAYHSGHTEDLQTIYQLIRDAEPDTPLAILGISLGGNVLLKWLGQQTKTPALFAAAAVSVPFQLDTCADTLDQGLSRLYRTHLVGELKKAFKLKREYLLAQGYKEEYQRTENLPDVSGMTTFWEFDHHITAALNDFDSVHHYYREASSRQYIKHIKVPTLMIQAADDPFINASAIPTNQELSNYTTLEVSQQGGHVGFIGGAHAKESNYWLDERLPQFFAQRWKEYTK
ncbi:MAG: alpha/beta fold hydrolase [Gammaproteobacteria bacterium]|nr:alpha/beta fold hydrolase [Gammaproteobacteria bacterium]